MTLSSSLLRAARTAHLYFGVFIAPALLFFAVSGALQTFDLHESARDGGSYKPAHWILVLAQLHKHQSAQLPPPRKPQAAAKADGEGAVKAGAERAAKSDVAKADAAKPDADPKLDTASRSEATAGPEAARPDAAAKPDRAAAKPAPAPAAAKPRRLPLQIFFLIVCLGLFSSVVTGLYMSFRYRRGPWVAVTLLLGVVVPLLLMLL